MAIKKITSSASSGDGTLSALVSSAADGDIIVPDESIVYFGVLRIFSSSAITVYKSITIKGNGARISLESTSYGFHITGTINLTLEDIDIIGGSHSSTYAGGITIASGGPTITVNRCRVLGCSSKYHGSAIRVVSGNIIVNNSVIAGCRTELSQPTSCQVYVCKDSTCVLNSCTVTGNTDHIYYLEPDGTGTFTANNCILAGNSSTTGANYITSNVGFALPPPDTIDKATWDSYLWYDWCLKLTPESQCLTGGSGTGVDYLKNTRKSNGAIGAYEGSWKVIDTWDETWTLTQNETVEYLDVRDRGCIKLAGYFLNVQEKAYLFSNASFDVTDGKYGYIGCNEVVEYGDFHEEIPEKVIIVQRGADVASVSVSNVVNRTANIEITKNGTGDYVVLAGQIGPENWARITIADGSFVIPTDRAFKVRVFDGDKLLDTQPNPRKYYFTGTTTGSFAEKTDWALDPEKTLDCNESPTVAGCTFICE